MEATPTARIGGLDLSTQPLTPDEVRAICDGDVLNRLSGRPRGSGNGR